MSPTPCVYFPVVTHVMSAGIHMIPKESIQCVFSSSCAPGLSDPLLGLLVGLPGLQAALLSCVFVHVLMCVCACVCGCFCRLCSLTLAPAPCDGMFIQVAPTDSLTPALLLTLFPIFHCGKRKIPKSTPTVKHFVH